MWQTIGQSKILNLLQRALADSNLSHAYLMSGPPQVGKMTLALDLAMALNCSAPEAQRPCGECASCLKIKAGKHSDVELIEVLDASQSEDGKSKTEIGTEQIKRIIHSSFLPPFEGRHRVYIVNDAAQTSLEAANRLLKTLEEHRGQAVFILLTCNPRALPATVVSRCQVLNLSRVAVAEIERFLGEKWGVDPAKAGLLARLSHGCPGCAVAALHNSELMTRREQELARLREVLSGDYSVRFGAASQLVQQFARKRDGVYEILENWIGWWHDILMAKTGCHDYIVNIDYHSALVEMAGTYRLAQIKKALQDLSSAEEQLKLNANPRLALEVLMLNLPAPAAKTSTRTQVGALNA